MLPREHGSWALLVVPIAVGLGPARGGAAAAAACFAALALFVFLARVPLLALASGTGGREPRAWLAAYGLAAAAALAALVGIWGRWGLLAFAVPGLAALAWTVRETLARRQMTLGNELGGVLGLSLGAPAAYYAATGTVEATTGAVWALAALYLCAPVFHVKAAGASHRAALNPACASLVASAKRKALAFHAAACATVGLACGLELVPWLAAAPFALALLKTARLAVSRPAKLDFRALGWREVAHAAVFTGCMITAYRW